MKKVDYQKACYMLARNTTEYVNAGCFDDMSRQVLGLIPEVEDKNEQELVDYTFEMLKKETLYAQADMNYRPILVYKSEELCFGVLNHFADLIIDELDKHGENVEIFDANISPLEELIDLSAKTYKAVIGIQSYLFSIRMADGSLLHDRFDCPLYNMFFDHPTIMHQHLSNSPKRLTVITHDRNYKRFIETKYGIRAIIIPPGGEKITNEIEREYDLSFVGSCGNYRDWFSQIREVNHKYDGAASKVITLMRRNPQMPYEEAVDKIFIDRGQGDISAETYFDLKVTYLSF